MTAFSVNTGSGKQYKERKAEKDQDREQRRTWVVDKI